MTERVEGGEVRDPAEIRAQLVWRSAEIAALLTLSETRALSGEEKAELGRLREETERLLTLLAGERTEGGTSLGANAMAARRVA